MSIDSEYFRDELVAVATEIIVTEQKHLFQIIGEQVTIYQNHIITCAVLKQTMMFLIIMYMPTQFEYYNCICLFAFIKCL